MSLPKIIQKILTNYGYGTNLTGNDNDVVHKTNNEDIYGTKTFKNSIRSERSGIGPSLVKFPHDTYESRAEQLDSVVVSDTEFKRLFLLRTIDKDSTTNNRYTVLYSMNKENTPEYSAALLVGLLDIDGAQVPFAQAPSTPQYEADGTTLRTNSLDILTRDWIPKDTRIVHTTGNETINGIKTFNNVVCSYMPTPASHFQAITGINSSGSFCNISTLSAASESNFYWFTRVYPYGDSNSQQKAQLILNNPDVGFNATLEFGVDSDGIKYALTESTSENRVHPGDILTRDWIPKDTRIVHTTGDEEIDNYKYFTSAVILRNKNLQVGDTITTTQRRVIHFQDKANYSFGQIQSMIEANGLVSLVFLVSQNKTSNPSTGSIYFRVNANGSKDFFPSDTSTSLGLNNSNNRWGQIYSTSSTISTSDARLKSTPETVPSDVLDAWSEVDFVQFKMLDSVSKKGFDKARTHNGIIAQNIDEVFKKHNLDAFKYGLFCYDEWDAEEEVIGENGIVEKPALEAGDLYSLRYEEALCMEAAYNRRRVSRVEERLLALEQELAELKKNS